MRGCRGVAAVTLILLVGGSCTRSRQGSHLPREAVPAGWTEASRHTYDRESLFDYINGGAERYLSHGFRMLHTARYTKAGGDELTLDLYRLSTPDDARRLLAETRVPKPRTVAVGDEARLHDFGLVFRQGATYGEITVARADPALHAAAQAFARAACRPQR